MDGPVLFSHVQEFVNSCTLRVHYVSPPLISFAFTCTVKDIKTCQIFLLTRTPGDIYIPPLFIEKGLACVWKSSHSNKDLSAEDSIKNSNNQGPTNPGVGREREDEVQESKSHSGDFWLFPNIRKGGKVPFYNQEPDVGKSTGD